MTMHHPQKLLRVELETVLRGDLSLADADPGMGEKAAAWAIFSPFFGM